MSLNKDITTLMKGYGIMFIALHNLLHVERFTGFIKENENSFDVQRTLDFFNVLNMCDWSIFGQFFSFLGWIGVPVFIFVSGYGLVKKHEKDNQSFVVKDYILHNWKNWLYYYFLDYYSILFYHFQQELGKQLYQEASFN